MFRAALILTLALSTTAVARGKSKMIEFRSLPTAPKKMAALLAKEKPGAFREQLLWGLETKLRDLGTDLTDPDAVDALTTQMFQAIFEDMAAPTDTWIWEGVSGPRGDVLIREKLLLKPGLNSSGYEHAFTVRPKGKRIDRGYFDTPCTVKVLVAKSPGEWSDTVASKGWGAFFHGVKRMDGVVRVGVTLVSPNRDVPRHERPVWVAFFTEGKTPNDFKLVTFEPSGGKDQRQQETNLLRPLLTKFSDAQQRHILAVRMEDVRIMNPDREEFGPGELDYFSLRGLTEAPVNAKTVKLLDPFRASDAPLVRAAAVLKAGSLGGEVAPREYLDVLTSVKLLQVQSEARSQLEKLLAASTEEVPAEDLEALKKAGGGDEVKALNGVAMVRGAKTMFFAKSDSGWTEVKPKR